MSLVTKTNILLTGAGFSANFGGLLAKDMWSKIFNDPRISSLPKVREKLLNDFDFESVYSEIIGDERKVFEKIVFDSFLSMDNGMRNYQIYRHYNFSVNGVIKWLGQFSGTGAEIGAHFTLNQDLFIERESKIIPLGIKMPEKFKNGVNLGLLGGDNSIRLPDLDTVERLKIDFSPSSFLYIKLHGSLGWKSFDGNKDQLILGLTKPTDIEKEPLLNWYITLFKEAVSRVGVRLFIIGYSFRDKHINSIIVNAINNYKIKIYIISPEDAEGFSRRIRGEKRPGLLYQTNEEGVKIWNAIHGYFPCRLSDIFPQNSNVDTAYYSDIQKVLDGS